MPRKFIIAVLVLFTTSCFCQEQYPRPTFPDVFQTEIEGTFIEENGVVEIDASMFYDRKNNRAALFVIKEAELTRVMYTFDSDESVSIDGNDCDVQPIPDEPGFFPFTVVNGKKKMSAAEEAFFFTKSKLDKQSLSDGDIPTLIYKANISIPQYGQSNCDVTHIFSKPDFELSTCKEGIYCNSTLITIAVRCKNDGGGISVDHVYRFSRFKSEIEDESVFLPPPGVHCEMKNSKTIPPFPSYFSFTFDIIEKTMDTQNDIAVFNTHKEIWYDAEYRIVRVDEFDYNGLLFSSRIFDLKAEVAFTIIATYPTCDVGPIGNDIKLDEITRLPKAFFVQNNSATETAIYAGKRKVHGLDYEMWSLMWRDPDSDARIVEEIYFLQIVPNKEFTPNGAKKDPYFQISHVDMYTYEVNDDSNEYELVLLKYFSINNYRSKPKEWAAFDVASCFTNNQKKEFSMKVEGFPLVKGSKFYREILELLYNKIIAVTSVSIVRISELRGIFDGVELRELKGSIIDNSKSSGWPTDSKEPRMEETFHRIVKAASDDKLSVTFIGEDNKEHKVKVISVESIQNSSIPENKCFSGASLAAASLVLLLIGISFGIIGYYTFLKKRKISNIHVRMNDIDS